MVGTPNQSEPGHFENPIQTAQECLRRLLSQVERSPQQPLSLDARSKLAHTLEQLGGTAEAMQRQQEALVAAQQALAIERQRYQNFFESAPDAYLVTNSEGIILEANRAATRLLQRPQAYLIGKAVSVFVPIENRPAFCAILAQLPQLLPLQDWEVDLQTQQGKLMSCAIAISPVHPQSQPSPFRWLIRDITQRHQSEMDLHQVLKQERELSSLKSRIINTISHEYRTPLSIISLAADTLKNSHGKLTEDIRLRCLQQMQTSVSQLTSLVEDTLTLNQIETGRYAFSPAPLNLEQICRDLVETMQLTAKPTHQFVFTSEGDCTQSCMDETLLRQILVNLLSNAVKYSPDGGTICLTVSPCESVSLPSSHLPDPLPSPGVRFAIQDEGIGIPPEDRHHLFEPFHRASNVGTIRGTGMGMAIVKRAVELHGGEITVQSEVGVGTTITVTLPFFQECALDHAPT